MAIEHAAQGVRSVHEQMPSIRYLHGTGCTR